jgi:hypothetical protein
LHDILNARTLAGWGTAHAVPDLSGVHIELRERTAQRVAMHAKFIGSLALIAFIVREDLKDIAALELPNGIRIRDARTMHLNDKTVQFALQGVLLAGRRRCDTSSL